MGPERIEVGRCIYCGASAKLSDEHVIPRGLGGDLVLARASCPRCAEITSRFERDILRNPQVLALRSAFELPTYHPKNRPDTFRLAVTRNGEDEVLEVPAQQTLLGFPSPNFPPPGFLRGATVKGISVTGIGLELVGGLSPKSLVQVHEAEGLAIELKFSAVAFAQLLAKIAYGSAVAMLGLDSLEEVFVLPSILGQRDDIGTWAGCPPGAFDEAPGQIRDLHEVRVLQNQNRTLMAIIRLFRGVQYQVIIGRAKAKPTGDSFADITGRA